MVCFICNKRDTNFRAAGLIHASKTAVDKQHVKETTEKIKAMAIALDNKPILNKLSSGNTVSNELNYITNLVIKTSFAEQQNKIVI